jgi:hypothetical protein
MKPFRYVQSFVDRKTGAVFHYFRRRGYPRIRLCPAPQVAASSWKPTRGH